MSPPITEHLVELSTREEGAHPAATNTFQFRRYLNKYNSLKMYLFNWMGFLGGGWGVMNVCDQR